MRETFRPNRTAAMLLQLGAPYALGPAVIVADDTGSLADAISAASTDSPVDARTTRSYGIVSGNAGSSRGGGSYATEYGAVRVANSTVSGNEHWAGERR